MAYRSGFERTIATNLKRRKVKFEYETLKLDYVIEGTYNPDFILPNGVVVEAKGKFDQASRRKMLAVKKAHPDRDIRMLFQRNQKLQKGAKMTYGQWCDQHGFPWAEGWVIPESWLK